MGCLVSPEMRRAAVLRQVRAERIRQDQKFGEQNRPSVAYSDGTPDERCAAYWIPTEEIAKLRCNALLEPPEILTFADIALEEFAEVIAAADEIARREELVQLAAVCVNWIECIDRRAESSNAA